MFLRAVPCALAAALLLAGCASSPTAPTGSPATSAPFPSGPPLQDSLSPAPAIPTGVPYADAVGVARQALLIYIDHSADAQAWADRLAPLLSDTARAAYAYTDPTLVPIRQLIGDPVQLPGESDYLSSVQWQTDIGIVTVQLSRRLADGSWQVERFVLPEGVK